MDNAFVKALMASDQQLMKQAASELYTVYSALRDAGFDQQEALSLMLSMMPRPQSGKELNR